VYFDELHVPQAAWGCRRFYLSACPKNRGPFLLTDCSAQYGTWRPAYRDSA
jgi:hypothetical protein